jgi:hypothetical protein|tara:strand:+ start:693 stop:1154 length:462 start_codon:yes stop_codon:yes gene_type:complete
MNKKIGLILGVLLVSVLSGCATVPMDTAEQDIIRKTFDKPSDGKAGIYIYRDSSFGGALKKYIKIDGFPVGDTGPNTYFYVEVAPGSHKVATQSEFGENEVVLETVGEQNYYIRQYIKMGLMVGGAELKIVDSNAGQKGVLSCKLARSNFEAW